MLNYFGQGSSAIKMQPKKKKEKSISSEYAVKCVHVFFSLKKKHKTNLLGEKLELVQDEGFKKVKSLSFQCSCNGEESWK